MIFISYAKEDAAYAHKVFLALHAQELSPWMDKPPSPHTKEGLQVGQKWEVVLQEKLKIADYIILILSPRSVAKRGYVQVEFRTALDRMNYLPDDDVLVLPILIEPCDVPSLSVGNINLRDLHWDIIPHEHIDEFAIGLAERIKEPV
ncbi:TIR domain-containing protein [Brucella pseudogrignonensis]|uniref:toll/interleukin-1 receptor domain-containing protein n=1 Tax=Brucella pseudogrignonensis TaxID=419475 RepID=UPI0007DA5C89|nr:toll/interleukin-1 receptor domain-containing protein [Brucella pseudogrignonensis]ANG98671.1 TIR domain-containing protein [Brucella pseudogrignonensis]